jgi:hypothetical protein
MLKKLVLITLCLCSSWVAFSQTPALPGTAEQLVVATEKTLKQRLGDQPYQALLPEDIPLPASLDRLRNPPRLPQLQDEEIPILSSYTIPGGWDIVRSQRQYNFKSFYLPPTLGAPLSQWIRHEIDTLRGTLRVEYYYSDNAAHAQQIYRWLLENNPRSSFIFCVDRLVYDIEYTDIEDYYQVLQLLEIPLEQQFQVNAPDIPSVFSVGESEPVEENTLKQWRMDYQVMIDQAYRFQYKNDAEGYNLMEYFYFIEDMSQAAFFQQRLQLNHPNWRILRVNNVVAGFEVQYQ